MKYDPIMISKLFNFDHYILRGDNLMARCPKSDMHIKGSDNHYSFGFNLADGSFNCFSCGFRGLSIRSMGYQLGIDIPTDVLFDSFSIPIKENTNQRTFFSNKLEFNALDAYNKLSPRGVTLEAILKTEVTFIDGKLVFPCKDVFGRVIGFTERCDYYAGRYGFGPTGASKTIGFFGMPSTNMRKVYLVEGVVDALKLLGWGYNGLSCLGNRLSDVQADMLVNYADWVCLVPDIDAAGRLLYKDVVKKLKGKIPTSYVLLPEEFKDIGHEKVDKELFLQLEEKIM
jgi:hypothetical protein